MLTEIRDRSSGWFAWVIAVLIIIPMAFWGVNEYATTEANPSLVKVGEKKITEAEFQTQFYNQQERMRQAMGENVDNNFLNSDGFKQRVLQEMINRALLEQVAEDHGYRIGDQQLAQTIKDSELFQTEGKFDESAYDQYVQSSQYSRTRYETALRNDKRLRQVTTGYEESALVLPDEIRRLLEIQAEKRSFDLLTIKQSDYLKGIQVGDAEISEYYDENQMAFLNQEKVAVNYLELSLDKITETLEIEDEELLEIYQQNADSYISTEKRETRHILLNTNNGEDVTEQLAKAESLIEQLNNGSDFAVLAEQHSGDAGSAARGGSLGKVEPGQMVPEFEKATFSLAEGEISSPIKSQFGYHIIQVQKIHEPEQQSFADVKFDLMQEERARRAEEILLEKVDELRDLAFEQPSNIDAAAEMMGLSVLTSALFARDSGVGIAASEKVRDAAFSDETLVDERNSEPIEVTEGHYVVIRKAQYQAAEAKPLAEVREAISKTLTNQSAAELARQAGDALLEKAHLNWQAIVEDESLQVASHTIALIDNNRIVGEAVLRKVTSLSLPDGQPVVSSADEPNGDYHIVRLTNIEAGDINSISEQIKDSTRRVIAQRNGQSLMMSYIDSLNHSLAPEINYDLL